MKRIIVIILFSLILFCKCKKKDTNVVTPASSGTSGATTNTDPNGSGTTNYDILFEIINSRTKASGFFGSTSTNVRALYSAQTVSNEVQVNLISMGTVKLNSITLANHLYFNQNYYVDTTYTNFTAPYIWAATGSASCSALNFTNNTSFPAYSNYTTLPDSVSKSSGFTINLSGLNGCDYLQLSIVGPSGSQYISPKIAAGTSTSIGFSPSELTGLNTGNGFLTIKFLKDNVQVFNGKKINLRSGIGFTIIYCKIKA